MRHTLLIWTTLFLSTACNQTARTSDNSVQVSQRQTDSSQKTTSQSLTQKSGIPDSLTKITGDFNGDGEKDFAVVVPPYQDNHGLCEKCIAKIGFSNNIDTLTIPYEANGAIIYNVGDLDGNKTDELLLIPDWLNSCLGRQWVYTYKSNKWDTIASGEIYRCVPSNTIKKINNRQFTMTEYIDGQDSITTRNIK